MYNPPTEEDLDFDQSYKDTYDAGYKAAEEGKSEYDNPHLKSGHERDTTYSDELNYYWSNGWDDFKY